MNAKKILNKIMNLSIFYNLSDDKYLRIKYYLRFKKKLELNNPKTFNEKLQWLKLNDRKDIYTIMVDKYKVKKYVSNIIGKEFIIPTYGIYNSFDEIDFSKLPDQFVIKCTHDSGGLVIVKDKKNFDLNFADKRINKSLKRNYYYFGREWPYKKVKPKILIEKYMQDKDDKYMKDYKIFCFDGKPELMYLSEGLEDHKSAGISFYDMNFNLVDCKRKDYRQLNYVPKKPKNFELMKKLSAELSKNIPHVRVDWYEINGKLYFGELTFFTCSGFIPFEDEKWDYKLGELIDLSKVKKDN